MRIRVQPVASRREMNEFIKWPMTLYRNDPCFVPPLISERKEFFSPHNPIFKFKRGSDIVTAFNADGTITAKDGNDDYVGTPTPEEYFTLPDYNNVINADTPVKLVDGTHKLASHYLHSTFVKIFDKVEDADAFVTALLGEMERFLLELEAFVDQNEKFFEWEKLTMESVNPDGHNQITLAKGGPSFTEGRSYLVGNK